MLLTLFIIGFMWVGGIYLATKLTSKLEDDKDGKEDNNPAQSE